MKAKETERISQSGVGITMSAFANLGYAFREQKESDYGIDAHAELIDNERPTGQLVGIQIKTGTSYLSEQTNDAIVFRSDKEHIEYWQNHSLPVIVAICDQEQSIVYWQIISSETIITTGKGHKILVPLNQQINQDSKDKLKYILSPVIPHNDYTVFKTEDSSHIGAKRYSFDIVLHGIKTKAEIAAVVRQATSVGVKRQYYRNHLTEGRWGDADADVVWIFAYLTPNDRSKINWICRSLWIREDLPNDFRPSAFKGEKIGGLITVDWNTNYKESAKFYDENTLSKEDYIKQVVPLVEELEILVANFNAELTKLSEAQIKEDAFITSTKETKDRINKIYMISIDMGSAPFECSDVDQKFQELVAYADAAVRPYTENGIKTWPSQERQRQALQFCADFISGIKFFRYEMEKVR